MLICDHLVLRQGDFSLTADLVFAKGQITALIGPSGAGKSTFLAALAGFVAPRQGRILWEDADLTARPPGDRPISIIFQDNNLFPHLNVMQNLALALRPNLRMAAGDAARISEVLADVGLQGLEGRKPAALSGGQQSRVALARVLLAARPVVLLDEPFAALGPALRHDMLDLVKAKLGKAGQTVLMVTHDPADAQHIAGQAVFVAEGRITPPVPTRDFFASPSPALAAYLG